MCVCVCVCREISLVERELIEGKRKNFYGRVYTET